MKIHSGSVVFSAGTLPFSRVHDDLLAIDQQAGFCYSMNAPAARIWELIPEPTPVSTVCGILCTEFGVDPEQCMTETIAFLSELSAAGLIIVAD